MGKCFGGWFFEVCMLGDKFVLKYVPNYASKYVSTYMSKSANSANSAKSVNSDKYVKTYVTICVSKIRSVDILL